jgi:hypothetical protein
VLAGHRRGRGSSSRAGAGCEGYPYPTNLNLDQPIGSLNPESQAELTWRALSPDWDVKTYLAELDAQGGRRRS